MRDLQGLLRINGLSVHQIEHSGVPYVGLDFECAWDPELGVGALLHGTRTVEIGGVETACLLWITTGDANANS